MTGPRDSVTEFTCQVGRNVDELRMAQGLSMLGLANRAGIANSLIYRVITGRPTTTRTLEKIAWALRVKPYQLLLSDTDKIALSRIEVARQVTAAGADHHRGTGSGGQDHARAAPVRGARI